MNSPELSYAQIRHQDALRRAHKQAKAIRAFYISATWYAVIIPLLWIVNLFGGGKIWAFWPMIGWGIGLTIHGLSVFAGGTFFGPAWEERKVEELMARENLKIVSGEKQLVQAQMRMLQAQIEPHFLFNTLATIQSLIARTPDKAELMMENFIAYLRQSLNASRAQAGTLKQEFELLRNYLELLKIRMGNRLDYTLVIEPGLDSQSLPPMLLQPLVENAVKHGLEPKVSGGQVRVAAGREGEMMCITVGDNGLGFGEHADYSGTGIGLANVRERLNVLYDGRATLAIAEANPGTEIRIRIPLTNVPS